MQLKDISMHRRAVAAMVHSECMSATCFIQVHMCQHRHVKNKDVCSACKKPKGIVYNLATGASWSG